jgi:hypothetical protein
VLEREPTVNAYDLAIDEEALQIIARRRPGAATAGDMRDHARNLARHVLFLVRGEAGLTQQVRALANDS